MARRTASITSIYEFLEGRKKTLADKPEFKETYRMFSETISRLKHQEKMIAKLKEEKRIETTHRVKPYEKKH